MAKKISVHRLDSETADEFTNADDCGVDETGLLYVKEGKTLTQYPMENLVKIVTIED